MTKVRELLSRKYVYRDAGSGEYVTHAYALLHPLTTVAEPRYRRIEPME